MSLDRAEPPAPGAAAWPTLTLGVAAVVTGAEGYLLHRQFGFIAGGFLAGVQLTGWVDIVRFLAVSLVCDASLLAVPAWLLCRVNARRHLGWPAGALLASAALLAPIAVLDYFKYQLARFVGDALGLDVLQGIFSERRVLLHAVWTYVQSPAAVSAVVLLVLLAGVALGQRLWPREADWGSGRRDLRRALGLLATGVAVCAISAATWPSYAFGLNWKISGNLASRFVRACTDFDRDGWGLLDHPADPALFDARIFPYALDIPGNGIDEDGIGGDLPESESHYSEPADVPSSGWQRRPDVIVFMLESVRSDVLDSVENGRVVTPVMLGLLKSGRALRAYSHNGFTVESRHHFFTGSLGGLRGRRTTLIDDFHANGYQVAYFSGQDESFGGPAMMVGARHADAFFDAAMARSERYTRVTAPASLAVPYQVVEDRVRAFLAQRSDTRPLFLYVNFHDTHFPYWHRRIAPLLSTVVLAPPEMVAERRDDLRSMYLNAVANVDAAIGRTLQAIRARLSTPPVVIVTSDHGESLLEEGFLGHGYALTEEQTRVPFVVSGVTLDVAEPLAQSDVREAIARTMGAPDDPVATHGGRAFQYIGSLTRPLEIALRTETAATVLNFDTRRIRFDRGAWRSIDDLDGDDQRRFQELVWFWERLVIAKRRHPDR